MWCAHLATLLSVRTGVADDEILRAPIINVLMDSAAGALRQNLPPFAACGPSFTSSLGQSKTAHGALRGGKLNCVKAYPRPQVGEGAKAL